MLTLLLTPAFAADPALCAARTPCRALDEVPAGAAGAVVHLALHDEEGDAWMEQGATTPCLPHEYWLVPPTGAPQLLLRLCNDGYGAAGLGEDIVRVVDGALTWDQFGGSNWRWQTTKRLALAPLAVVEERSSGMWTLGPNEEETSWSWSTFSGTSRWYAPACGREDAAAPEPLPYVGQLVPSVTAPDGFAAEGWRTTRLGSCAAAASFVAHGAPGTPADSALRAVLLPGDVLIVEVVDDTAVSGAASWLHDDHVELWVGSPRGYMDPCLEPDPALVQWGVRLADGAVFTGHGQPPQLRAEVAHTGTTTRLRLQLPGPPGRLTVVFSDSDDGATQERLLATSDLRYADASTLGAARAVAPDEAVCEVRDGALEPRATRAFTPAAPALCCAP